MIIRHATHDDIPAIVEMAETFVAEAIGYGMEFDAEQAAYYVAMLLDHPGECAVFVNDDITAGAIATIAHDWCKQPVCYVEKLFVLPSCRGSGASRVLINQIVSFAAEHDCSHVFASATAGMGERVERLFVNLFRKYGFAECGPILSRSLSHE